MSGYAAAQSDPLSGAPAMPLGTAEPVAFWDSVTRGWDADKRVDRLGVRNEQVRAALWARQMEIAKATGVRLQPSDEMFDGSTGAAENLGSADRALRYEKRLQPSSETYEAQIDALRASHGDAMAKIETRAQIAERLGKSWSDIKQRAAEGAQTPLGALGNFVGGSAAAMTDAPNVVATVLTGPMGASRPLLTRMAIQGAANAGTEAIQAPLKMDEAKRTGGPAYTAQDAAADVVGAGLGGAAFEGVAAGVKTLAKPLIRQFVGGGDIAPPVRRAGELLATADREDQAIGRRSAEETAAAQDGLVRHELPAVQPARDITELATPGAAPGELTPTDYRGRTIYGGTFAPAELAADPVRFQYKADGDAEGVTARLKGVDAWDATASGKVIVWEDRDGARFVADGHQRRALALRMEGQGWDARLDGYLMREADGWSARDVRAVAALKNIREGSGSPLDAAKIFREAPEALADRSLPLSGEFMAQGRGLAHLSDEAFGAVINKVIPERYASEIGALAAQRPDLHMGMVRLFKAADPGNVDEARALVMEALTDDWVRHEPDQGDLFGYDGSQSAMIARARIAASVKRALASDARLFGQLIKHADAIEAGGNALARDANEARLAIDRVALEATAKLALRAGPIGEAMAKAVERVGKGDAPGTAARDVLKRVREAVEAGESLDAARAQGIDPAAPSQASRALLEPFDDPAGKGAQGQAKEAPEDVDLEDETPGLFDDMPQVTQHEKAREALLACVPAE